MSTDNMSLYFEKKQICELVSGDVILHPIFRSDGLMLVNKNRELSSSLISMVKKHVPASTQVLVAKSEEALHSLNTDDSIDCEQKNKAIHEGGMLHKKTIAAAVSDQTSNLQLDFKDAFDDLLREYPLWLELDSKLESEHLKRRAMQIKKELVAAINTNKTFIVLFNKIRSYSDVLLMHSMNTMCIALMLGLTLELNTNELLDLALSALFCNIGFVEMGKKEFLHSLRSHYQIQGQLKRHLEIFSDMTMNYPELRKKAIVFGILDHHEYYNGKGCPHGKKGEEISLFGRILGIAHNYDIMVGGYHSKAGLHPLDALRIIYDNVDNRYDHNIINVFMHRTTYFKLGETIYLPNIQKGVIIGFSNFIRAPHLPIIRLENNQVINLAARQ